MKHCATSALPLILHAGTEKHTHTDAHTNTTRTTMGVTPLDRLIGVHHEELVAVHLDEAG